MKKWYYADSERQVGPVAESEIKELVEAGVINSTTLIWCEGMLNWQPYSESVISQNAERRSSPETPAQAEVVCAECGRSFLAGEVIPYGNVSVCANCKPIFVQKLQEGVSLPGTPNYAGFWRRAAAYLLDGLILYAVSAGINLAAGLNFLQALGFNSTPTFSRLEIVLFLVQVVLDAAYGIILVGKYGATFGKMALRLRVVTGEGNPMSYARAVARYLASLLSYLTCMLGFLWVAWDQEKRALHDLICNTRVVRC